MSQFQPCPSCACHVRRTDTECPFCGTPNAPGGPRAPRGPRMSRGQWLALTTAALVGCTGAIASTPEGDGGHATAAGDAGGTAPDSGAALRPEEGGAVAEAGTWAETGTVEDASPETRAPADSGVACGERSGFFSCEGNICDRAIQACYEGSCEWYGNLSTLPTGGIADAASCGSCPTCACLQLTLSTNCHCTEDDEGTIAISCGHTSFDVSWGDGTPPTQTTSTGGPYPSGDVTHVYQQAAPSYTISVTEHWGCRWSDPAGNGGSLTGLRSAGRLPLEVREIQTTN